MYVIIIILIILLYSKCTTTTTAATFQPVNSTAKNNTCFEYIYNGKGTSLKDRNTDFETRVYKTF